ARGVGGERRRPVAVAGVEEAQVAGGCMRRTREVNSVVALRVDDEAEAPRGGRTQLPEPDLAEPAARARLEAALDRGEQGQSGRQARVHDQLAELWRVAGAARHGLPRVVRELAPCPHASLPGSDQRVIDAGESRLRGPRAAADIQRRARAWVGRHPRIHGATDRTAGGEHEPEQGRNGAHVPISKPPAASPRACRATCRSRRRVGPSTARMRHVLKRSPVGFAWRPACGARGPAPKARRQRPELNARRGKTTPRFARHARSVMRALGASRWRAICSPPPAHAKGRRATGTAPCRLSDDPAVGSLRASAHSLPAGVRRIDRRLHRHAGLPDGMHSPDGVALQARGPRRVRVWHGRGDGALASDISRRVRSLGPRGTASAYSSMVSAMTLGADADAPSTPTDLAASASRCGQVDLAWAVSTDTGSGVMAYNVYRDGFLLAQVMAPATVTADTSVAAYTPYSYAVSAVDHAGNESPPSTAASVKTPLCRAVTTSTTSTTTTIGPTSTTS